LAVILSTTMHPQDVFLVSKTGEYDRLTRLNPQVDTWKLPQISLVTWEGANGDEVEGILELPPDYELGGAPLPMVVELHGGPTSATMYRLRLWIYGRTLLAAKGYALLSPNYRGSTGYGDKFMTDLIGHENEIEIEDILKGVQAMIDRGIADPDRIGVIGWSNGGFLTNGLITKSDVFKAASSGAGVLDMVLQWGTEDTPGHVVNYMKGALPWDNPEAYRHSSPMYDLDKIRTPTLIHVGGDDARVPAANSRALYRALRHYLDVPVELVVYPGEGHGLNKYKNRLAKMEWDLAWFDKYLLGKTKEQPGEDAGK
ncbi:MAG: prolyl oligopeptidase family serine peptidase, partial [Planctomycetes bacterium]|nr:prolyl oligopeptidase family serine peptidase [Planctomycetota bacterium]